MKRILCFATVVGATVVLTGVANAQRAPDESVDILVGVLRVHPKFHYRYYIDGFGDGQKCALFNADDFLKQVRPGSVVRVQGELASKIFGGDPKDKRSAMARTWIIYMDVAKVNVLRGSVDKAPPAARPPRALREIQPQ